MKITLLLAAAVAAAAASTRPQGPPNLPPVPAPAENPITAPKAVLGKLLFWEEQLSSDDTVSCGTCHRPTVAGADPRIARHPGADGVRFTADDVLGSPGVVASDAAHAFAPSPAFGLEPQVTRRTAPSAFTSQYSPTQFWDGRSGPTFRDPLTGAIAAAAGGSLEDQSLHPLLDATEMAHPGRTWADVVAKLAASVPMALATDLPADVAAALAGGGVDYPELFRRAFGDPAITPVRIAFALATYERTLVADQTPWDRFNRGQADALTAAEQRGLQAFRQSRCDLCHRPPFFTDHTFRNLGVRPIAEDRGRQEVTGSAIDAGRFKVPSLRNVGARVRFMHQGRFGTLREVLEFYGKRLPNFGGNLDPDFLAVRVPPQAVADLEAFLRGGLTDPRAAAGLAPFDRPTLRSERPGASWRGTAVAGTGGIAPTLLAHQPAFPGASAFRLGIADALAGAPGLLVIAARTADLAPFPVYVDPLAGRVFVDRIRADRTATFPLPIPADPSLAGITVHAQAVVVDAGAPQGLAASAAAAIRLGG